jgi:hypothetical protein
MSLALALERIIAARKYTLGLLEDLAPDDWFRTPTPAITHIAWQVGHLAVAEYRMGCAFLRESKPTDDDWFPQDYRRMFGRDSVPIPDANQYPSPEQILTTLSNVHEHVLAEQHMYNEADLDAPVVMPHRIARTKREALFWCSLHEGVHAGQIALLRRLFGRPPQW